MTDLTKITTPFGLLDAETQEALRAHGGPYEFWNGRDWEDRLAPLWCGFAAYRVKPQPPKPREVVVCYHQNGNAIVLPDEIRARDHGWSIGVNAFLFRQVL